ncbi:MAG: hypothetical protein IJA58_00975, partial [Lachnospiraceae bacterium]|nr:hypothetical protein [Lachnospiraceae bacterium]
MKTNLKKLAKGNRGLQIFLNVLMVLLILLGVIGLIGSVGENSEATLYTADSNEGDLVYVDAQYASDFFAYFDVNDSHKLYFIMDKDFDVSIVCIPDNEIGGYEALQAYTFGETKVAPDTVRTEGKLVTIDDELMQLAISEFNWFIGENKVTAENCHEFFGKYYIDTTVGVALGDYFIFVVLIILAVIGLVWMAKKNGKVKQKSARVLATLAQSGETELVDEELSDENAKQFKKIGVYLTKSYLISYRNGLVVVPLSSMNGLYGVVTDRNYELVVREADEAERVIVQTENKVNQQWDELAALVTAISNQVSDLEYGAGREKIEGSFDITQIEHFFIARRSNSALEVQTEMTNADGTIMAPNFGLGIVGALIGALIGGVLWVVIGKMGYIAGIAGFVIIYLAAMGFKKGAKVLTRSGAVIAVIISALMIFAANYMLYVWIMTEA